MDVEADADAAAVAPAELIPGTIRGGMSTSLSSRLVGTTSFTSLTLSPAGWHSIFASCRLPAQYYLTGRIHKCTQAFFASAGPSITLTDLQPATGKKKSATNNFDSTTLERQYGPLSKYSAPILNI